VQGTRMMRWAVVMVVLIGAASVASACDETNSPGATSPSGASGDGGEAPPPSLRGGGW
jgi:hypothetical protein